MLDPSKKLPREIPTAPSSDTIDVAKWIAKNYDPFDGQFTPSSATERTKALLREVEDKQNKEIAKGGVLCCDSKTPSTILSHGVGYIADDCVLDSLIVGLQTTKMLERTMKLKGGTRMVEKALKENGERMDPFTKKVFEQNVRTHNECVFDLYTPEMRLVRSAHALTGLPDSYGRGRLIGDYRRVALYGLDRLIEEKQRDAARLDISQANESNMEKKDKIAMQIRALHSLDMLAKQYGKNISKPATTAKEAAQAIYFAYLAVVKSNDGAAISFGRVDAFLDIYFEHDFRTGVLASEDEAQEIIDNLVLKLRLVRHLRPKAYDEIFAGDPIWATNAIAGVLEDANHGTKKHMVTKTSYRFLQTLVNLGAAPEPNMTVLFDECLPEGFKKFATDISITSSSVQYINDKLLRENWSCDTTVSCCVSGMRLGKDAQFFGARCNLPKILLYALNDGKDEISGNQIAPIELAQQFESLAEKAQTDENFIHLDYEDVKKRFETYMDWIAALYVSTMNVIHFSHEKYAYESLLYALMDSEPDYNMAFGIAGLSVLVDSLSAIKHAKVRPIFSEETDMKGIITSFDVKGEFPKYGNDSDDVDELAKWVVNTFIEKLRKTPAFKNAKHTLSILTITSNVMYGSNTGATPDGRKLGEAFAPGANPMHGRDDTGALNSLNSVAKVPYGACLDGISNTFSITKGSLGKDDGSRTGNLGSLLAGYFEKGAMHLNVNVLSRDTLKDAQIHPENYPNLTIRVSGYAVKFIKLSKAHQDEVISRTFHEFM
jgi:formate C-acetyltransferase|tara:strand:- start:3757 stop:6075 length:2319 start_codon:yes stop_codon:yes gene_type:complete